MSSEEAVVRARNEAKAAVEKVEIKIYYDSTFRRNRSLDHGVRKRAKSEILIKEERRRENGCD